VKTLIAWLCDTKRRHLRALVRHPHHYVVAAGLTAVAFLFFKIETAFLTMTWGYAVLENLTSMDE
jgi:hypothetical protein